MIIFYKLRTACIQISICSEYKDDDDVVDRMEKTSTGRLKIRLPRRVEMMLNGRGNSSKTENEHIATAVMRLLKVLN